MRPVLLTKTSIRASITNTCPFQFFSVNCPTTSIFLSQSLNIDKQQRSCYSSGSWNWKNTKTSNNDESSSLSGNSLSREETTERSFQSEILDECAKVHSSIMPLNQKLRGPLAKHSDRQTCMPFVFLVGNHSSGKSSFINYVLGRNVQTAGVAPTDDCFTVITPGAEDSDQDGPALIGDPDFGFSQLRHFGPTLIHHTQLKIRSKISTSSFMMVDSPGMIDSPMSQNGITNGNGGDNDTTMDRGYDFQGVVQWFAERADVVLLFFDPDKPGTTGETLSVLLHSLSGMEHKLLIVLNKADQFRKIHDFARAYGSLCWNLSKVIPRKDMPRIFTMCLPVSERSETAIGEGLADLHHTRDDVVAEVMKAPKRRIDNVITHLNDSVNLLLMHAKVAEDVRGRYSALLWGNRIKELGALTTGVAMTALGTYSQIPLELSGVIVASTIIGVGGLNWFNRMKLSDAEVQLLTSEELSMSFRRTHVQEITDADEFTASTWQRIREVLKKSLEAEGLGNFPTVNRSEIGELNKILDDEIPKLRRKASPSHFGSK